MKDMGDTAYVVDIEIPKTDPQGYQGYPRKPTSLRSGGDPIWKTYHLGLWLLLKGGKCSKL